MSEPGRRRTTLGPRGASFFTSVLPVGLGERFEDIWLVSQLIEALEQRGITVIKGGPGLLVTADGMNLGLSGLVRQLRLAPRAQWAAIVDHHAGDVASSRADGPDTPDLTDPATVVYPRVIAGPTLGSPSGPIPAYALPLGADLYAVAAYRRPGRTMFLMADDALSDVGGWAGLLPRALHNLRELELPALSVVTPHDGYCGAFFMLESSDTFGSARMLLLDELVHLITDEHPAPRGVLVGAPHRHLLLLHVVVGEGIETAIEAMGALTASEYQRGPGPLSPLLYYAPAGRGLLEHVTVLAKDSPRVSIGPNLAADIAALSAGGPMAAGQ